MKLQGPNSGITWKDYQIATPTFDLTSIEKPDLSPFLIHMTGRNKLLSILRGENAPEGTVVDRGQGFLKASIPAFDGSERFYNSRVVCFTESPLFALDFFRYRSYARWRDDQQFGIGFSKTDLVTRRNVRPVVYLDSATNRELLNLCNGVINDRYTIVKNTGEVLDYKDVFKKFKPLLFPLLEDIASQGFMWEREWRCPDPIGLTFPLSAIKVICCPADEREAIEALLAEHLDSIQIVESWKEYDDVTSYLKRRKGEVANHPLDRLNQIADIAELQSLKQQNDQTLNTLASYYDVFKETVNQLEGKSINDTLRDLGATSQMIADRITQVSLEAAKAEAKKKG